MVLRGGQGRLPGSVADHLAAHLESSRRVIVSQALLLGLLCQIINKVVGMRLVTPRCGQEDVIGPSFLSLLCSHTNQQTTQDPARRCIVGCTPLSGCRADSHSTTPRGLVSLRTWVSWCSVLSVSSSWCCLIISLIFCFSCFLLYCTFFLPNIVYVHW